MFSTRSSCRVAFAAVLLSVLTFAPATHAQLTYERTILADPVDPCDVSTALYHLAGDQAGGFLGTGHFAFARYTSAWTETFYKVEPIATYQQIWGAVQLSNGRIVTPDYGWGPLGQSFIVWEADGRYVRRWPAHLGSSMTTPELGAGGDFYHAVNASGIATVRQFGSTGEIVRSWSVTTAASHLAVRNDVVYLAGDASGKIYKFALDGTSLGTISTLTGAHAQAIDVDAAGRIYVLTRNASSPATLWILSPDGAKLAVFDRTTIGVALVAPMDVLVRDSRLYISDPSYASGAVHEFALDLTVPAVPTTWGRVKALYR